MISCSHDAEQLIQPDRSQLGFRQRLLVHLMWSLSSGGGLSRALGGM
jgi:hypothetical protein